MSPKSTATLHTRHSKKKLPQLNEVDDGRFFFTLHGTSATIPLTRQPVRDLGVWIDSDPYTFKEHTERVTDKALKHLGFLRSVGSAMSPKTAYSLYLGFVYSVMSYGAEAIFPMLSKACVEEFEKVHRAGQCFITGCPATTKSADVAAESNPLSWRDMVLMSSQSAIEKMRWRTKRCPLRDQDAETLDGARHGPPTRGPTWSACR